MSQKIDRNQVEECVSELQRVRREIAENRRRLEACDSSQTEARNMLESHGRKLAGADNRLCTEIVTICSGLLRGLGWRRIRHAGLIDDCMIAAFSEVLARVEKLKIPRAFLSYLIRSFKNEQGRVMAGLAADASNQVPLGESVHPSGRPPQEDVEDADERARNLEKIQIHVGCIPNEKWREAFDRYYLRGEDYSTVATRMSIPKGTAKAWSFRGKEALREHLQVLVSKGAGGCAPP